MLGEPDTIFCQSINVWSLGHRVSVAAKITVAEVIGKDEDNVGKLGCDYLAGKGGEGRH